MAALVYGLSNAATSPDGTSHWGDARVMAALAAGVVLLAAFAVIETRSRHALAAAAAAAQPRPGRREPRDAGRGDRRLRRVLLRHPVRAGRVGLLPAQDGSGVPAADRRPAGRLRGRERAGAADRRAPAPAGRRGRQRGGPVLAVPGDRARQLRQRAARPGPGARARARACCSSRCRWSPWPGSPRTTPGWRPACSTPAAGSAAPSASRCSGTVAWTVVAHSARAQAAGGRADRSSWGGHRGRRPPTGTRWRPASTAPSWSPPGSPRSFVLVTVTTIRIRRTDLAGR